MNTYRTLTRPADHADFGDLMSRAPGGRNPASRDEALAGETYTRPAGTPALRYVTESPARSRDDRTGQPRLRDRR
ncbi:hypothetical protein AB0M43_14445 [Longispora sp. NPDC051575]|uniref:hypothetical protein n=1 Tax=Longispora sp. NPDC051575 TaxID=3154943 RepID=UPI00342A1749